MTISLHFSGQIFLKIKQNGSKAEDAYCQRNRQQKHHHAGERTKDYQGKAILYYSLRFFKI